MSTTGDLNILFTKGLMRQTLFEDILVSQKVIHIYEDSDYSSCNSQSPNKTLDWQIMTIIQCQEQKYIDAIP